MPDKPGASQFIHTELRSVMAPPYSSGKLNDPENMTA